MWEFSIRILAAGVLMALSGWTGAVPFEVAWKVGLLLAGTALLAYHFETKGTLNPGIAGLIAGGDALAIAIALSAAGGLEVGGALSLVPLVYAMARRGSYPAAVGAIGAGAILTGSALGTGASPPPAAFIHAAIALLLATVANQERITERPKPIAELVRESGAVLAPDSTQTLIELRAQVRKLQRTLSYVERASRVDHVIATIAVPKKGLPSMQSATDSIRDLTQATRVVLHLFNSSGTALIPVAASGFALADPNGIVIRCSKALRGTEIKGHLRSALESFAEEFPAARTAHVILHDGGEIRGVLTIVAETPGNLEEARERAEEAAERISTTLRVIQRIASLERRAREAELLYEVQSRMSGARTIEDIGHRTAFALRDILDCDDVNVWIPDGEGEFTLVGKAGRALPLLSHLELSGGIQRWKENHSPPIAVLDASTTRIVDPSVLGRYRIQSFFIIPFGDSAEPSGYIVAASKQAGKMQSSDSKILLAVAAELGRLIPSSPSGQPDAEPAGILSPTEFRSAVVQVLQTGGSLLHVEPTRAEETLRELGAAVRQLIVRTVATILRRHLPSSAQILQTESASFVALLPGVSKEEAERLANELTAVAAMHSVDVGEEEPLPLGIRVRVADLDEKMEANRISGTFAG